MKNVLVIYYTQSGQLLEIAKSITSDLELAEDVNLSFYQIEMEVPFLFPWKKEAFFNEFPESFLQIPSPVKNREFQELRKKYDLIILAYQVWFLTPSIPMNSFLKSEISDDVLKDTPVLTVIGCRNMWVMAQEKTKKLLANKKALLVGNIVLIDKHINHVSVITISHWMFSGLKTRFLKVFPRPGVSDKDIDDASVHGKHILKALRTTNYQKLQESLLKDKSVCINPFLVLVDKRANMLFAKWANFIVKKGAKESEKRLFWVKLFKGYLLFAIWFVSPIVYVLYLISYPFSMSKIKKDKKYYASVKSKI